MMSEHKMKYSKATDYALHSMMFLAKQDSEHPMSVIELAALQNISPSYLSKILTKLSKERLINAISGANGGYSLRKNWQTISILEIVHAIEGRQSLFECYVHEDPACTIKKIMLSAEEKMEAELAATTLLDLITPHH